MDGYTTTETNRLSAAPLGTVYHANRDIRVLVDRNIPALYNGVKGGCVFNFTQALNIPIRWNAAGSIVQNDLFLWVFPDDTSISNASVTGSLQAEFTDD